MKHLRLAGGTMKRITDKRMMDFLESRIVNKPDTSWVLYVLGGNCRTLREAITVHIRAEAKSQEGR